MNLHDFEKWLTGFVQGVPEANNHVANAVCQKIHKEFNAVMKRLHDNGRCLDCYNPEIVPTHAPNQCVSQWNNVQNLNKQDLDEVKQYGDDIKKSMYKTIA